MEPQKVLVKINVNGKNSEMLVDTRETLLDAIRDHLNLTGPKKGCYESACGACTVLIDDEPICSCNMLAVEASGSRLITIEGLAQDGELERIQRAFIDKDGFQCGFCTSGQIMSAYSLVNQATERMSETSIKEAMSGNLCRCGAYTKIVDAILEVIGERWGVE